MAGELQPLVSSQRIVNLDGTPNDYFIRWAQQRQIDIGNGITAAQALEIVQQFTADHVLTAGSGISLTPSGNIADDLTIAAEVQAILDQISTTQGAVLYRGALGWDALAPGTSGDFLKTNGAGADPEWAAGGGGGGSAVGPHRYWGILNLTVYSSGTNVQAAEVAFRATAGGAKIVPSSIDTSADFNNSSLAKGNSNDNNVSTRWASAGAAAWWIADYGSAVTVRELAWTANTSQPDQSPIQGTICYSDDGVNWTIVSTFIKTAASWVAGTAYTFDVPVNR